MAASVYDNEGYGSAQQYPDLYLQGLGVLTQFSNEKEVAAQYVRGGGLGNSVLDIGAGNGKIAQLLGIDAVERYVAIEQNALLVAQLNKLGILAIEGTFPDLTPDENFDTVFSSHSMPVRPEAYAPFIRAAYERVTAGGHLGIITYSDLPSDYASILAKVGSPRDTSGSHVREVGEFLQTIGDTTSQILETEIRSTSLSDVMAAIAFVDSTNGNPDKMKLIMEGLHAAPDMLSDFRDGDGYSFPLHSQAYRTKK